MRNSCILTKRGQQWTFNVDKKLIFLGLLICVHNSSSFESLNNLNDKNNHFYNAAERISKQSDDLRYKPLCQTIVNHNKEIDTEKNYFKSIEDLSKEVDPVNEYSSEQFYPKHYTEISCVNTGEVNYDFNNNSTYVVDRQNLGICSSLSNGSQTFHCIQQFRIIPYLVFSEPANMTSGLPARYAFRSQIVRSGCECQQKI